MKKAKRESLHRKWSQAVTDGAERAAGRAMLHAVGFTNKDVEPGDAVQHAH